MSDLDAITQKLRRLVAYRERRDQTKLEADLANEAYRDYEQELFQEIDEGPLAGSVRLDLGEPYGEVAFRTRSTIYGRINDLEQALEAFEEEALTEEITKSDIRKRRLHELVRERIESGQPLPNGVDFYENRGITISRKKGV